MSSSLSDYGVPDNVLYYERIEAINTMPERVAVLGLTYYPASNLWNPPYRVLLSGLPASALPVGFSGSGIPAKIRDVNNSPYRMADFLSLAQALGVGVQQFRRITLPWFVYGLLAPYGGLKRDFHLVVGGGLSGAVWVDPGEVYQVMQFSDDVSEGQSAIAYCRKKAPTN